MWRSVGAVVGGYVGMALLVILSTMVMTVVLLPDGLASLEAATTTPLPASYLMVSIITGLGAAVVGGWLAARLAPSAPLRHVGALVALVVVMAGVVMISQPPDPTVQPAWYCWAVVGTGVVGVLLGGWLGMGRPPRSPATSPGLPGPRAA